MAVLAHGGDVAANLAEEMSALLRAEGAGDLLFDLDHAYVPLSLVVVKRDGEVIEKGQDLRLVLLQMEQEVLSRGCALAALGIWVGQGLETLEDCP